MNYTRRVILETLLQNQGISADLFQYHTAQIFLQQRATDITIITRPTGVNLVIPERRKTFRDRDLQIETSQTLRIMSECIQSLSQGQLVVQPSRVLCLYLAFMLTVQPAMAWSECGHHIIAVLAFDLMKPDKQLQVLELLKHHPRFAEDFKTPGSAKSSEQIAHWQIGRAGYWPDVARRQPEFNRPNWHYQLGSSLTIGQDVKIPETPGPLPPGADLETKHLHITQAIELCRGTLRSPSSSDADKAIAICWIAHLVADSHQPCHAGSLYVDVIFPEGDRGANSIPTKQSKNLHALWDGLLGNRYGAGDVDRRAREIRSDSETWDAAELAGATLEPLAWLSESEAFGRLNVYTPEVLAAVEAAQRSGAEKVEVVDLPESYLKAAGAVAQKRAAFAAWRLAAILSQDVEQ